MKKAFYADYIYYNQEEHYNSYLLVNDDKVVGITTNENELSDYSVKKFNNSAIFPGLINTHGHIGMSYLKGIADDLPLMTWLKNYIWPIEGKFISPDFVYKSSLLAIAESIRSGVTFVSDMYFNPLDARKSIEKSGIRGMVGFGVMENFDEAFKSAEQFEESEFVRLSMIPHALYTVKFDIFKKTAAFAQKHNCVLQTHLAETLDEEQQILERYGKRPVELMNDTGAFDGPSVYAHCVHLNDSDIELMASKKDTISVSHCLESNLKLASGFAPVKKMMDAGINVSIGTDGNSSNNDISMLGEMSTVSKFHKALNMDATCLSAETVLNMATKNAAKAIHMDSIGSLEKGKKADFFVLSFDATHMTPVYNPISHLIYIAKDNDVTDVYINGSPVMENRKILTFDEEELKNEAREVAKEIKKALKK